LFCNGLDFWFNKLNGSFRARLMASFKPWKSTAAGESQLAKPVFPSKGIWSSDYMRKGCESSSTFFFFPQLHFTLKYSSWLITITRFNNFFNSNARVYYIETMNYFVDMSKQCKRTYSFARASGSTISIVDFSNLQFSQLLRLFTLCQL
jgi:hypothetical protein